MHIFRIRLKNLKSIVRTRQKVFVFIFFRIICDYHLLVMTA